MLTERATQSQLAVLVGALTLGAAVGVYLMIMFVDLGLPPQLCVQAAFVVAMVMFVGTYWLASSSLAFARKTYKLGISHQSPTEGHLYGDEKDLEHIASLIAEEDQHHVSFHWVSRRHGARLFFILLLPMIAEEVMFVLWRLFASIPDRQTLRRLRLEWLEWLEWVPTHYTGITMAMFAFMAVVAFTTWLRYLRWRYEFLVLNDNQIAAVNAPPPHLSIFMKSRIVSTPVSRINQREVIVPDWMKYFSINAGSLEISYAGEGVHDRLRYLDFVPHVQELYGLIRVGDRPEPGNVF